MNSTTMASFKFLALAVILCTATINLCADAADVSYDERALKIDGQRLSFPVLFTILVARLRKQRMEALMLLRLTCFGMPTSRFIDRKSRSLRFLKVIQDEGLYAILRIGPYVCAEWNYGGFPVWLNSIPDMTFRTQNDAFMYQMKNFTTLIVDKVKEANLFASEGGPIILAQIENEYGNVIGSYGNDGKSYMNWCANFAETLDTGVPWIMCQESDAPPSMINTCNGWYCDQFSPNKNMPKMWTENWSGWYKNWGGKDPQRTPEDLAFAVARFFQYGGTLQNYYMYHGGTNFGRTAGGPYITTSYDYDAPLDEYGNLNQPKWGHLKKLHSLIMSMEKILTYGKATSKDYGGMMSSTVFEYNGTRVCFLGNANNRDAKTIDFEGKSYTTPAWSVSILPDCVNVVYNTAESTLSTLKPQWRICGPLKGVTYANQLLDQKLVTNDTSDYLWYMTSVDINEDDPIWGEEVSVRVQCDCHILHAFFNGKHIGTKWVTNGQYNFLFETSAKPKLGTNSLSLLSVTVGLQNYGAYIDKAKNGILGPVTLVAPNSLEKDLTSNKWAYKVGLNGLEKRLQEVDPKNKRKWHPNVPFDRMFVWYKTTFKTPKGEDPVVLDLYGLGKGTAWYHVPRSFLNDEDNTLVLFEEFGGNPTFVSVQTVTMGSASAHAYEGNSLELSCEGRLISNVKFASFGNGTYGSLEKGSCHSPNSLSVVKQACIGKESCSIDASEQTFGPGTCDAPTKSLAVEVQC
ncbi:UNVERIFIED_CONTAM: Beta-galactosidase 15 [Sesamum latifolium]|uniref:Beta-galactosidase n=1 Tax=Sesamum latifolium TaxID=2727402 RepID=A0AAW2TYI2_9LAMI